MQAVREFDAAWMAFALDATDLRKIGRFGYYRTQS